MAVTDNFNRANGGLGANWTTAGGFSALTIVSNACQGGTASQHCVGFYTAGGTIAADQYAQVKVTNTGGFIGPVLRGDGINTFYVCYYNAGTASIYKWIGASPTQIGSGSTITPAVNDVIYFEAVGTALTFKLNGVTVCTATDSSITGAGYTGINIYDNVGAVDDFEGGVAGAVTVTVNLTGVAADPQIGTGTFQIGVVVLLTGVGATPQIGTGTVQIAGEVVTPPVEELVPGRNWYWPQEETVDLTGVAASPRIGNGTVRVTLGGRVPEHLYFPKRQPPSIDSSDLVGDLAKLKILAKRKPPEIAVELIPPPVPIKKPAVFVQLTGVEVARVEKVIERYEEEMLAFLDSL